VYISGGSTIWESAEISFHDAMLLPPLCRTMPGVMAGRPAGRSRCDGTAHPKRRQEIVSAPQAGPAYFVAPPS
jgi:hypothetical protein